MNSGAVIFSWLVVLATGPMAQARPAEAKAVDDSVTTRWLPDPFPNVAPRALDRFSTVEMDTASRTPSVLLGVYDVENDPLTLSGFTKPTHGRVTANQDGTFTYTPQRGYAGEDQFTFTLGDGRGGFGTATMHLKVIRPTAQWATTSFTELAELKAGGEPIRFASAAVPRAVDWDGDGRVDLLVGANGGVTWFRNTGTAQEPAFAAGVAVEAGGKKLQFGNGRVAIAWVDMDRDGKRDLVIVSEDRKVRWARNISAAAGTPRLAEPVVLQAKDGGDFVAEDIRADIADWNGDGLPDVISGSWAGAVKIAYNVGTAQAPVFDRPVTAVDADGRTVEGAYNLNVRITDLNLDGLPDFVDSYNWGNINFRLNTGSSVSPRLPSQGAFSVTGPGFAKLDLHALTDGPIVDFADFNGDGTIDLVIGSERGGAVRLAFGESGRSYLHEIGAMIAAHPRDLGPFLADPANAGARSRMQTLQGALYDYVTTFATPSQKREIVRGLLELIASHPQYFKLQPHDLKRQPGIPSLAVQVWLTTLVANYEDPAARRALADAAQFTGGYRKLVEDIGLIYADNAQNPRGAEAIYQWVRTIPREIYPGTGITANDWLGGGGGFLVRGHLKNTFNGAPVDAGEYGFGQDARAIIGERGSENWFMTVVHHEACHDVDAYVRKSPLLSRRWGQVLVMAGGPDMRADPQTGWLSWELTKRHFRERGLWDGAAPTWEAAWKKYWAEGPGAEWNKFGFMRGNISWFYGAPQESLATQGNQFWNSTEGRMEVAIDRWKRGFKSNLSEVLFFMEIWSLGLDKMKFCENDNACRQVFSFARLRRNQHGYIDRVDLGDRYYEFAVDDQGVVTALLHTPERASVPAANDTEPISRATLDAWSAPYRGWHYHPDPVIPAQPDIPGHKSFHSTDCPCVYQLPDKPDRWFMSFIAFNGQGYNSFVAESTNLVQWTHPRLAMGFGPPNEFDHGGCVIGAFLYESYDIKAPRLLKKREGQYWSLYGCYPRQGGYELRPGYEGVAVSDDGLTWRRGRSAPILAVQDPDCSAWEKDCIYQPWLVEHRGRFYDFYNAANGGTEQTGLAFSTNLLNWVRYEANPVITNRPGGYDAQFASDPKVFRDGDHWVMFYFGVGQGGAHIMAAFSRDLQHWTSHPDPLYKAGGHPGGLDKQYAHKISLVHNPANETFYLYYCAVGKEGAAGNQGRCIGLLTSRELKRNPGSR